MIDAVVYFVKTLLTGCQAIWNAFKLVKKWFK